jgi:hypothetical protein
MQAQAATEPAAASGNTAGPDATGVAGVEDSAKSATEAVHQDDVGPASAPLPLPYALDADGHKQPLPGAKALFIRGMHGSFTLQGCVSSTELTAWLCKLLTYLLTYMAWV